MSLTLLASNNASTVLASSINASATTLTVNTGAGSLFPNPVLGTSFFKLTLIDAATGQLTEIVHVTARTGDVMTIERAQEGTAARVWSANDIAANMMTAGTLSYILGNFQPLDATLTALAALTGAANKLAYFNGDDTAALTALTSVGRDIIGKSTIADVLSYLGLGGVTSLRSATFTASGSWTCPSGVTQILLDGCGGGGGGSCGAGSAANGNGGGGASSVIGRVVTVVPGTIYTITIGAGGSGGTSSSTTGTAGGTSSFGTLLSLAGGGGASRTAVGSSGGEGGTTGRTGSYYSGLGSFGGAGGGCYLSAPSPGAILDGAGITPSQFGGGGGGGVNNAAGGSGAGGLIKFSW